MLAPSASSAEIFDQDFKYIFSTLTGNETVSVPIAKLVTAKNKDIKRVAILARNDLFPLAVAQEFEKAVKARGLEVVTSERYAIGTMDHSAAITQMRAARPDWVYASGYINDLILIRKQMNDLGLKAQVITVIAGPAYQEFAKTVGPLAENITSMSWWHPAVRYKGKDVFGSTEAFNAAWEKKYGGEADYIEAGSAACGAILQMAIEAAGSIDPAKVRDAIAATRCRDLLRSRSSSPRADRSTRCSRRCFSWSAASRSCSGPTPSSRASSASCRSDFGLRGGSFRRAGHPAGLHRSGGRTALMIYLQIAANGLVLGGLYACIAVGFSLVWGVLNVINILHGTFIVLGSYVAYFAYVHLGIHPFVSIVIAGARALRARPRRCRPAIINRVVTAPVLITLTLTFGLDLILNNAMLVAFTADYRAVNARASARHRLRSARCSCPATASRPWRSRCC